MTRYVVVSGLPGSGKTMLGRQLTPALTLPLIDKDDILERLFDSKGAGDAAWRRALSRESDRILQDEATASQGAVLVSHWHLPGMPVDSGTPTGWLTELTADIVNVHCVCPVETAAERFCRRQRHPAHLDNSSYADVLASLRAVERLGLLDIGVRIDVDTSTEVHLDALVRKLRPQL